MTLKSWLTLCLAVVAVPALSTGADKPRDDNPRDNDAAIAFFEKKVRPLLADNCYNCHSANTNARGGLRVDDRVGLVEGGGRGPAVEPGDPDKSLLMQAVRRTHDKLKMPPDKQLTEDQIADLALWIRDGAAWPKIEVPVTDSTLKQEYDALLKDHWAWQPLASVAPPAVNDASWPLSDIDRFILARLERFDMQPSPDTDPLTLLRRLTFDLTGLPPTLTEIDEFLSDGSPHALENVVDRLLASPAYGERWGRHWLDVARYAESTGSSRNVPYPHAWRYRDYVVDAFNRDKPFDQFVREQIAGDLLPAANPQQREEQLVATGFLALGVKDVNQRFKIRFVMDNIDEQIDAVSRAFLALTASCARCHDHKFDPIPTADYYALAGIFKSSDLCAALRNQMGGGGLAFYDTNLLLMLGPKQQSDASEATDEDAKKKKELAAAREELDSLTEGKDKKTTEEASEDQVASLRARIKRLQREIGDGNDPALRNHVALGVREAKTIGDTEIRVRGEAEKLGPTVPRGFLSVVSLPGQPPITPGESGRRELAQWLTSEHNPLTPRVMVNRVWQHLMGEGLVRSVDNFGVMGDTPSHPELLDALAIRFVKEGWSVKKLVRAIVLTRAYRLSAEASAANIKVDPGNIFLWRHSPRRLDAEEIRDATLVAAGRLDGSPLSGSPAQSMKVIEVQSNSAEAQRLIQQAEASLHRSLYLPLVRNLTPQSLAVFDFAEQGMVTGRRDVTTVAPQALYLLNDTFVRRQALAVAERVLQFPDLTIDERVQLAYRLTLSRTATTLEVARVNDYVADYAAASGGVPLAATPSKETIAAAADTATTDEAPTPIEPEKTKVGKPARDPSLRPASPEAAAWASFCQALLGSAEFRYVK